MPRDWYDIKFLESASNVRSIINKSSGRSISASIAREIAVCIQQGRLFFEAAETAPLQIKPLQIYYGVVAFAKAVVVAKRRTSLATLASTHGLTDITRHDTRVEDLALRISSTGGFQEFNDAIAPLGRIWYYDQYMPRWFEKRFDLSEGLAGQQVDLKDILSRIPNLSESFRQTFSEQANAALIYLDFEPPVGNVCTLRIDDPNLFSDRSSLVASVKKWRSSYPFLDRWRFKSAMHAWGSAILLFDNFDLARIDDVSEEQLTPSDNNGFSARSSPIRGQHSIVPAVDILPPLSGGYVHDAATFAMRPLAGNCLPEYSLQLLGTFLLSSLVRYRPHVWQSAISRSIFQQSPADDRALSLVEKFLDRVQADFPEMVVRVIDYSRA